MASVGETFQDLREGMNGGVYPANISAMQYAKGINITCRGSVIRTRPPFNEILLTSTDEDTLHNIQYGKFQGMFTYHYEDVEYIAFAMSGNVYLINPLTRIITDLTAVPGAMSATVHRVYFCQVENYLIVQDGIGTALIALNTAAAYAIAPQVPIGTIMAYGQGRLFVKTALRQFKAGDINLPNAPTNVLNFTETQYLAGGGAFFTPMGMGEITGMEFVQQFGTATGLGPLMVFCKQGICSFDVSTPRLQWQDLSIMRIEAGGNGNVSHLGIVKLDDDLIFRTWGGISDFSLMMSQQANRQRITNLNMEVQPFLDNEDPSMLPLVSACRFQNRVLYTIQGEKVSALNVTQVRGVYSTIEDYRFQGLISLDFTPMDGISSLGTVVKPSYDGVWTGCFPMGVCSGIFNYVERCFIWGKDDTGKNHLFEIGEYAGDDTWGDPAVGVPINCRLYTRMTPFVLFTGNRPSQIPQNIKTLSDSWIWLSELRERVQFQLYTRPDRCFDWHKLSEFCKNAPLLSVSGVAGNVQAHMKTKWPELAAAGCQQVSGRAGNAGFEFEFCIEWDGQAEISRMVFEAEASGEQPEIPCDCAGEVLIGTERSDYDYSIYEGGVVGDGFLASSGADGNLPTPVPGPGAPITGGRGTLQSPYTMSGDYCTKFAASDAARTAGCNVGDYIQPTVLNVAVIIQVMSDSQQFMAPITGGLGTASSPFILGGGPYGTYHEANGVACGNFKAAVCPPELQNYPGVVPGEQLLGMWVRTTIYTSPSGTATVTFLCWDSRFYKSGPGFHPGEGTGVVADPWLLSAYSGGPLYVFSTLADAQWYIQRCWGSLQPWPAMAWPKKGHYFRLRILTVQTDVQVP